MSALLNQVKELLSEHYAAFSYGLRKGCKCLECHVYLIAIDNEIFEDESFGGAVGKAWSYVCEKGEEE